MAADRAGLIPDPWIQTALLCQTIANCNGNETKLEDFLLRVRQTQQTDFEAVYNRRKAEAEEIARGRNR